VRQTLPPDLNASLQSNTRAVDLGLQHMHFLKIVIGNREAVVVSRLVDAAVAGFVILARSSAMVVDQIATSGSTYLLQQRDSQVLDISRPIPSKRGE